MKTKTQTEITSPVVYKVVENGKAVGYLVPSNTTSGVCYQVTFRNHKLSCNCKAAENHMRCCHLRAVEEVMQARKAEQVATPALATYDVVGAALQVVNAEIVAQKVGDSYEQDPRIEWVTMPDGHRRLASQVNDPCLNSLDRMSESYSKDQEEWKQQQRDAEATRRINFELGMGY